jgi:hypothetical protein
MMKYFWKIITFPPRKVLYQIKKKVYKSPLTKVEDILNKIQPWQWINSLEKIQDSLHLDQSKNNLYYRS